MKKPRHRNGGIRKVCECPRRSWAKCSHPWHLNYKPRFGPAYRFSLDAELGRRLKGKTEAQKEATKIKTAIDGGTFRRRAEVALTVPASTPDGVTLKAFGTTFFERAGKGVTANNRACFNRLTAFPLPDVGTLGDKTIGAITEDDIELFFAHLRQKGCAGSTINKYVQLARTLFRWGTKKGYLARNPIADSEVITREKMAQRHRRLAPDDVNGKTGKLERAGEERALLAVAGPHLQRLIIGALESGCRLGELLRVEWSDVDLTKRRLTVRAENTKTRMERIVPISPRLAGVLEMAHTALVSALPSTMNERQRAAHIAACFVFGDDIGERVKCVRKAWDTAVLKAHGHRPVWVGANKLSAESRAALREVDLKFHDLRHEAGSRLAEAGWPLHHVQRMLGHKDIATTGIYLNVDLAGLEASMRRHDESVARCNPVANEEVIERAPLCNDAAPQAAQHQVN